MKKISPQILLLLLILLVVLLILMRGCGPSVQTTSTETGPFDMVTYNTIADMLAKASTKSPNKFVHVNGYFTAGDGGGGDFMVSANLTGVDDGLKFTSILTPTAAWQRVRNAGQPLTPQMFGAIPNDLTDDAARLQKAIDAAGSKEPLSVPAGEYLFTTPLLVSANAAAIRGEAGAILRYTGGAVSNVFRINNPAGQTFNVSLANLLIEGNAVSTGILWGYKLSHVTMSNVRFAECNGGAAVTFQNCVSGLLDSVSCSHLQFGNGFTNRPGYGIDLVTCNDFNLLHPLTEGVGKWGIMLRDTTVQCLILGGASEGNGPTGVAPGGPPYTGGGILISNAVLNTIISMDLEFNTTNYDILFINGANNNKMVGGTYGTGGIQITNSAGNELTGGFQKVKFDVGSFNNRLMGATLGVSGPPSFIDLGVNNEVVSTFNAATGQPSENLLNPVRVKTIFGRNGLSLVSDTVDNIVIDPGVSGGLLVISNRYPGLVAIKAPATVLSPGIKLSTAHANPGEREWGFILNPPAASEYGVAAIRRGKTQTDDPLANGDNSLEFYPDGRVNVPFSLQVSSQTANTVAVFDANKKLVSGNPLTGISVTYNTVAEMSASQSTAKIAIVLGYNNPNDGGGGTFYHENPSVAVYDGGLVFGSVVGGTWRRQYQGGRIDVRWFGATGTGANDYAAIASCIAAVGGSRTIYFPRGTYGISQPLIVTNESIALVGDGPLWSRIKYLGTTAVDAAVEMRSAVYPSHDFYMNMADLGIEGSSFTTNTLRLSRVCHSSYDRITLGGALDTYLRVDGPVLVTFNDLRASHQIGISSGPQPRHNIYLDGVAAGQNFANSILFNGAIAEGASDFGVVLTNGTSQVVWNGGTVEAGKRGILVTHNSSANTFIGVDCESNPEADLYVDDGSNFNVFESFLGTTGAYLNSSGSSLIGGRFGSVTFGPSSSATTAIGTMYNVYGLGGTNGAWTDQGNHNSWTARFNNGTAARDSRFHIDTTQSQVRSPFRISHSSWDTNYSLFFASRDLPGGGVVNFDLIRYNAGVGFVTNMTFGLFGQVSLGFPDIMDTAARLSVNGGLNVGASSNPGTGVIAADNVIVRSAAGFAGAIATFDAQLRLVPGAAQGQVQLGPLTGDVSTATAGSGATLLATVNANVGTFGNATTIPVVTVNGKGLVTGVTTVPVSGGAAPALTRYITLAVSDPMSAVTVGKSNYFSLPTAFRITGANGKLLKGGSTGTTLVLRNGGGIPITTFSLTASGSTSTNIAAGVLNVSVPADNVIIAEVTVAGTAAQGPQVVLSYEIP
jgi:hypothetical protein